MSVIEVKQKHGGNEIHILWAIDFLSIPMQKLGNLGSESQFENLRPMRKQRLVTRESMKSAAEGPKGSYLTKPPAIAQVAVLAVPSFNCNARTRNFSNK